METRTAADAADSGESKIQGAAAADAAGVHHDAPPGSESKDKDAKVTDPNKKSELYYRVVKSKSEVYDIITRSFSRKKRWNELPHGLDLRNSWNLCLLT